MEFFKPLFILLLFSFSSFAQETFKVDGTITDYFTDQKINDVSIKILQNNKDFTQLQCNGKYKVSLPLGFDYQIIYQKAGYVPKKVEIFTSNIPEENFSAINDLKIDMTLIPVQPYADLGFLEREPIGKAIYDRNKIKLDFDFNYANYMANKIEQALKKAKQKEEERQKAIQDSIAQAKKLEEQRKQQELARQKAIQDSIAQVKKLEEQRKQQELARQKAIQDSIAQAKKLEEQRKQQELGKTKSHSGFHRSGKKTRGTTQTTRIGKTKSHSGFHRSGKKTRRTT
ncbi:MAG: hypothetical protein KatS3mg028_1587 [Bacteroidia bacterium]|nr:MAG: hypothetical protein KatS3mg028_1587 [Bacteroidia bacterium]